MDGIEKSCNVPRKDIIKEAMVTHKSHVDEREYWRLVTILSF